MAYNLAGLQASTLARLQNHPRYVPLVVDAINKALDDLKIFCADQFDIDNCHTPVDPEHTDRLALEFPLPPNTLYVKSVTYDGIPLDLLPEAAFVRAVGLYGAWGGFYDKGATFGPPGYYYVRKNTYLSLWPRPSIADPHNHVQLWSVKKDPDLALPIDVPTLNRVYTICVEMYACWYMLMGQPEEEDRAEKFRQLYFAGRAEAKFNLDRNLDYQTKRERWPPA